MTRWVYTFGDGKAENQAGMKNLLGGMGAISPRYPTSTCRCRPVSPSPRKSAPTTTTTAARTLRELKRRGIELHEFNPMLGFRGCRLAVAYPEIAEMQARAIFEAAVEAGKTPVVRWCPR